MIASLVNRKSIAVVFTASLLIASSATGAEKYQSSVGMPLRIEQIVLPGSELVTKPLDETNHPIVLRVTGAFPHGSQYRYDLEFHGLEPGKFNLCDYLQRKDGSPTGELPPLTVEITSMLPPGPIKPTALKSVSASNAVSYRTWGIVFVVVWLVGLPLILFLGRKSRTERNSSSRPLTAADRLRPLVEEAMNGNLSDARLAQLERELVALWRKRLKLDEMKASDAIIALRKHEQAGALLCQLEAWLHRPGGEQSVDVVEMLKPYQDLPADELSLTPAGGETT